jgi:hypothetical protein
VKSSNVTGKSQWRIANASALSGWRNRQRTENKGGPRMLLTKKQQRKLVEIWCRPNPGYQHLTYIQFRRTVQQGPFLNNVAMVPWCGMWIGIEADGHAHT